MEPGMSSSIVHFGNGNYGAIPEDPTVAKPRFVISPARLQTLRRLKPAYRPTEPDRPASFVPGPLLSMRSDQCRYPIDDRLFCGARSVTNKSWCSHHDDVVHGRHRLEAAE